MCESASDEGCSSTSSISEDLSNLVVWAHTHGTICNQIPALEFIKSMGHMSNDSTVLWMCKVGHAYHWHCGKSHNRGEEKTEAVGRRKRPLSSSLAREPNFEEKRVPKMTPSFFEINQVDSRSTESCGRSQVVTEQNADSACTRNNKPRGGQNTRESITSFSAAEQHLSVSGSRAQTVKQDIKSESDDLQIIICDDEADEDKKGDRVSQDHVSEPSAEDLQTLHGQKMALHEPAASQSAACAPTATPPLARACLPQPSVGDSESPNRNVLTLASSTAAGPTAETSRARSLLSSAAPKVCLKRLPVSSIEARAQLESQPSAIFELQATAAVQQQLSLSPPEWGTLATDSSEDGAENMGEDSEMPGSRQTQCFSSIQSPESRPPAASNVDVLEKKKSYTTGSMKAFKEWLKLCHPSETRKIHALPPADLDHYLFSFFSCVNGQDGMDFSLDVFSMFPCHINQYLKNHKYQYSILKAPEFRASREAYKFKHWHLLQKKEQHKWSVVEDLTDEDMENLFKKGILSKTHPQGLLRLMFTNLIRGFGANTHYQPHQLYWGQVVLRKTREEMEYLEWKDDLSSGGKKGQPSPQLFATPGDPESCPVASYKEYARKRPPDMLNDNHPLYLSPKSLCSIWDEVWYSKNALTKCRIDKIFKVITQDVRRAVRKTRK